MKNNIISVSIIILSKTGGKLQKREREPECL